MLPLGQKVIIIGDQFEQNLPIGYHAYIIAYDRNVDNAFDYLVRIPKLNRHFFVPAADIELEQVIMQNIVDEIEREALIDFALATKNEQLFRQVINGGAQEEVEVDEHSEKEVLSREEFIKQVNLRAWI